MKLPTPVITPEELSPILEQVRLLDVRSGSRGQEAYGLSHVSGALHVDLDHDLAAPARRPEMGGRHPLPQLGTWARRLGEWGIDRETKVVVYDDQGGGVAARAWWMLRAVGHGEVALLDGGWGQAVEAGLSCDDRAPQVDPRPPYPVEEWQRPTVAVEEVDRRRGDPSWRVLDVRSEERFRGETEPYDPVAGHIPGALNLPYQGNLDADGRFLSAEALHARYLGPLRLASGEPVPPQRLIVHCGSGVTACHTLLALERAGLHGASLYVGSWSEWCRCGLPREP